MNFGVSRLGEECLVQVTHNGVTTAYAYGPDGSRVRKVSGGRTTLWLGADVEIRPRARS